MAASSHQQPPHSEAHPDSHRVTGQPQAAPAAASGPSHTGSRAASPPGAQQTSAHAAAAAAAQAALAGPTPATTKQQAPKYNPPGTSAPSADQAQQNSNRPPQQQQQQPVSALEALATAGIHHPPPRASLSQEFGRGQPRPQGVTSDPRLPQQGPHPQGGQGRPGQQLPFPDPRSHAQQHSAHAAGPGPMPGPTPSQQITAQAARLDPHRANQVQPQRGQGNGPGPLPPPMLQFGSVQHVPDMSTPLGEGSQSAANPLHFGIPAGMLPGAKLETGGQGGDQAMAMQAQTGMTQIACHGALVTHQTQVRPSIHLFVLLHHGEYRGQVFAVLASEPY